MKNRLIHRVTTTALSLVLAAAVAAAPALVPAFAGNYTASAATTFKDIRGHWAKSYIQKATDLGLINGYKDGTFRPDQDVTRAEFTKMLNTTLGNNTLVDVDFSDVVSEQWFCADVCKGVAAGYINGYTDGTFLPDNNISRQEAAVILARILPTAGAGQSADTYADAAEIAAWAKPSMEKIIGRKYMTGADNQMMPTAALTRAQAAKIIVEMAEGERIIKKNQTIIKDNITIKDTIYANQISVGSQVADGKAFFENSVVLGNINVLGGGSTGDNGVFLKDSRAAKLTVARTGGTVRIATNGESTVVNTYVSESALLQEDSSAVASGDFGRGFVNVLMNRKSDLSLNGSLEKLICQETKCDAKILKGSSVSQILIANDASRCSLELEEGASAETVNVRGSYAVLSGKGQVDALYVYADGLAYEIVPKAITIDSQVTVKPVQNIDPSVGLVITPVPSDSEKNVPVNEPIELAFTSAVHATGASEEILTDTQAASLILLKKGDAAGPNVEFTARVSRDGRNIVITPMETLAYDTTYFIRIGREDLTDEYKNSNEFFLSSFTTEPRPAVLPPDNTQEGVTSDEKIEQNQGGQDSDANGTEGNQEQASQGQEPGQSGQSSSEAEGDQPQSSGEQGAGTDAE